jgi:hypothetical protein
MLKYVRFRGEKKLEQDKLLELMDAIQDALSTNAPKTNPNSRPSGPSAHYEPTSVPMTKLEKQNIPSNNNFAAR